MAATLRKRLKQRVKPALFRALAFVQKLNREAGNSLLLTFDDGPDPEVTPVVLDRLKQYHARAVFFVVGRRIEHAPAVLRRIVSEGHRLGNHTFSHIRDRKLGLRSYFQDVQKCQALIQTLTGVGPTLFRPPQGRVTPASVAAPWLLGLKTVFWSIDPHDWRLRHASAAHALGEQLAVEVGPGDIVPLHDDNPCVLCILDVLLPALAARGCNLERAVDLL